MSVLVVSKIIRRCTIISVITLFCMGFITETEAMRSLFCCCCCRDPSPEPSATAPIEDPVGAELRRFGLSRTELNKCYENWDTMKSVRIEQAAEAESDPEKAYELWRQAIFPVSDKIRRNMNALIDDNIKRFCENDELFSKESEDDYSGVNQRIKDQFEPIILFLTGELGNSIVISLGGCSSRIALLKYEAGNKTEAIQWQKQAIFWNYGLWHGYRYKEELWKTMDKLKEMMFGKRWFEGSLLWFL